MWTALKPCCRVHSPRRAWQRHRAPNYRLNNITNNRHDRLERIRLPWLTTAPAHRITTHCRRPFLPARRRQGSRGPPAQGRQQRKTTVLRWGCEGRPQAGRHCRLSRRSRTDRGHSTAGRQRRGQCPPHAAVAACIIGIVTETGSLGSTRVNNSTGTENLCITSRTRLLLRLSCSSRCNHRTSRQKTPARRRSPRWASACASSPLPKAQRPPSFVFVTTPTSSAATAAGRATAASADAAY